MDPNALFALLGERWVHARWLADLRRAAEMCLFRGDGLSELRTELTREWMSRWPKQPWILLLADRADDFVSLCHLEHEHAWIKRMFASISDHAIYGALIEAYAAEGEILDARRRRVRNALVHGNPASFAVVQTVREYSEFLSAGVLELALNSYIDGTNPATALRARTSEVIAMQDGQDAASYWRSVHKPVAVGQTRA